MPPLTMARHEPCRILGTAVAFPPRALSNAEVVAKYSPSGRRGPRSPEEIAEVARTFGESLGVEQRHWTHEIGAPFGDDEATTVDLSVQALSLALEDASLAAEALGLIIATTSTPARITGANAPQIAARVGARCASFDVRSGCSGGLWSLSSACSYAAATQTPVAVVASDTFSKLAPPSEPLAPLAFGDAAAAAIVMPSEGEGGLVSVVFDSDGSLGHLGAAPAPFPVTHARLDEGLYFLAGDPEELARRSPALYADVTRRALDAAGLAPNAVDSFIPHQTSRPAIASAAKAAGIAMERTVVTAPEHGNCGTPGVLIGLDRARRDGRLRPGGTILFAALGGGLAWGAAVFRA